MSDQREIKFRAWDNKNNCWCSESELWINGEGTIEYGDIPISEEDDITIEFCTGLKDKNGKDLDWWEGDIYEFYLYGRFVITFIEGSFMFVQGGKVGKVNHLILLCNEVTIWVTQPTKVGTIHDHLLKSKENHNNG